MLKSRQACRRSAGAGVAGEDDLVRTQPPRGEAGPVGGGPDQDFVPNAREGFGRRLLLLFRLVPDVLLMAGGLSESSCLM
ncbi:hypothetical protein chiPu_0023216 [Chiloscyllium punctatum]|uniref:Uncharacterized protein n=1 Tax=Chiloscyllium punctatum TaxID=137246 RepID=A0A401T9N2_CHIPU|nr:hypothetical protein [Chiloscyllium punctatum]